MNDPNKYGVYWVAKEDGKAVEHGLICIAEDKLYAEHIKDALDHLNTNKNLEHIVAIDYPLQNEETFNTTNSTTSPSQGPIL